MLGLSLVEVGLVELRQVDEVLEIFQAFAAIGPVEVELWETRE